MAAAVVKCMTYWAGWLDESFPGICGGQQSGLSVFSNV